jgi:hypothetical protein
LGDAYAKIEGAGSKSGQAYRRALELIVEQQRSAPSRDDQATEALYRAKLGDRAGARRALEQARITKSEAALRFREARVLELAGDRDGAMEALRDAVSGGFSKNQIELAPELEGVRNDPRYSKLMNQ